MGVGIGKGPNPHNFILFFVLSTGLPGLLLVALLLRACYQPMRRIASREPGTKLIDGALVGRYLLVSVFVNGMLGGFLVLMAPGMTAMLMIGAFAVPEAPSRRSARAQALLESRRQRRAGKRTAGKDVA